MRSKHKNVEKLRKTNYCINWLILYSTVLFPVSSLGSAVNIRTSWRGFPSTITAAVSVPSNREPEGYKYYVFSRCKSSIHTSSVVISLCIYFYFTNIILVYKNIWWKTKYSFKLCDLHIKAHIYKLISQIIKKLLALFWISSPHTPWFKNTACNGSLWIYRTEIKVEGLYVVKVLLFIGLKSIPSLLWS